MRNAYWFLLVLLSLTVLCAPALAEDGRDCANGWHTFGEYEFDETRHWISCTGCGEIVETSNHRRTCLEDVCATCGASASEDGIVFDGNVIHHGIDWGNPDIWQHDQYTHWIDCPSCGEQADLGIHWASCENPDVCENCGATDVVIEWVSHSGINWNNPEAYEHDSMYHWTVCSDCGEIEKSPHNGSCTAPDVCAECQATNVTISYINHEGIDWNDPDRWQWNDNSHWTTCTACGSTAYLSEHSAFCDDSEVCSECSAKGVNISYINHETYGLEFDETKHWRYCVTCNERVYESEHYCYCDESDHCVGCDATVSEDGIAFGSGYSHHGIEWGNPDAWEFDATYHWTVCPGCGETVYHSEHMASCMDDQNTCESCGDTAKEDGITIKTGHYYVNWDEFCSDKDNHWYVCKYCDEHVDEMPHVGSCQDATGNSVKSNTVTLNAKAETSGKDAALVITAGDVNGDGAANEQDVSLLMSLCCENE